jgi:hypothetical protein
MSDQTQNQDNSSDCSSECSSETSGECEMCKEHFSKTKEQLEKEEEEWEAKRLEHQRTRRDIITEENKDVIEQTPEVINNTIKNWGNGLQLVREEFHTFALYQKAVRHHYDAIAHVKRDRLTKKQYYSLCRDSLQKNGYNIRNIPEDVLTNELFELALESACGIIETAPERFKTYKNWLSAVSRNGEILEHVQKDLIDKTLCEAAAKTGYNSLKYIPRHMITKEICELAVKANGGNIQFVPKEFMSSELGLIAVQSSQYPGSGSPGYTIRFIPTCFYTKELMIKAAENGGYSNIAKEMLTKEVEDAILEAVPRTIYYLEQTPERCLKALKADPYLILHSIKKESITKEVAELVLTLPRTILKRCSDSWMEYIKSKLLD